MKYIPIVTLFLTVNAYIKADFFAFRQLTHPQTKKTVYFLYDIHASTVGDSALQKKLLNDTYAFINPDAKRNTIDYVSQLCNHVDKQATLLRNNLPNLVKQHNDLVDTIKKYQVSLINEDWGQLEEKERMFLPIGAPAHKYYSIVDGVIGIQKNYGTHVYQTFVSPMRGISKALTSQFKPLSFMPFGKAYFFNPDARCSFALAPADDKAVDAETLQAIDSLFSQYPQNQVIVSLGYTHVVRVIDALMQKGYKASTLIFSNDLAKQRMQCGSLDQFLTVLEKNATSKLDTLDMSEELTYRLIAKPLNVQYVFASAFNTKNQSYMSYLYTQFGRAYNWALLTVTALLKGSK